MAILEEGGKTSIGLPNGRKVSITFIGANQAARPEGERVYSGKTFHYFGSNPNRRAIRNFERVRYRELYPGIDLIFLTKANAIEYNVELKPGADPRLIRIHYDGARARLGSRGDLELVASDRTIVQQAPHAYQTSRPHTKTVACSYRIGRHGDVTFQTGGYDRRRALVIDPVLNFSTYLGGSGFDAIYAMATDGSGNLYVTGETASTSVSGNSSEARASRDVFVAKLDSAGQSILYTAYLGGAGNDAGRGIAVDSSGNAYVTGVTGSSDFPTTVGAFSTRNSGVEDAFVLKLDQEGRLVYSTYLGGEKSDMAFAIALDSSGSAYIAGQTSSGSFPVTSGTFQTSYRGGLSDCFVAELNSSGSAIVYATLLGGQGLDLCRGIAVDGSRNVYVTGTSYSADFPTRTAVQAAMAGTANAFVAKVDPYGSALVYSTFLGGSNVDNGNAIAVDSSGSAYIAGDTASIDFPITPNVLQPVLRGSYNAFVARLTPDGTSLIYSTYLGGSGMDTATSISLDPLGRAVLGGFSTSPDFPAQSPLQPGPRGVFDAFAAVVEINGSRLAFSSCFGGSNDDRAYASAAAPGNHFYLAGMTASSDFPVKVSSRDSNSGNYDTFLLEATFEVSPGAGLFYVPVRPCRIADTRASQGKTGVFGPPALAAYVHRDFLIPASPCGIPSSSQAYALNITVVPSGPLSFLSIWPAGQPYPGVSTLNSPSGQVIANAAIVPAGANGAITFVAANATDLIIDINGYFVPETARALAFLALPPCRIVDTRASQGKTGAFGPPSLMAYTSRAFPITSSSCGIPATAEAYSLNMTVIPPGPLGFLSTWPSGQSYPGVSTLNSLRGEVLANAAIVPAGTGGSITVVTSNPTDLVIDANGYFAPPGADGLAFYSVTPCRIADTRTSQGKRGAFGPPGLLAYSSRDFPISDSECGIPASAQAYSLNITAVPSGPLSFLSVWPSGQPFPGVSTLNSPSGNIIANAAIVPAGASGAITVVAGNPTDLIIDINGYLAP